MEQINDVLGDSDYRQYLHQVIHRCVEYGGHYKDIDDGISSGCPLARFLVHCT